MGMELYGVAAQTFVEGLAIERGNGTIRSLAGGQVRLDGVIAWRRTASGAPTVHDLAGTQMEAIYEAAGEPTEAQRAATAPARAAGVDTRKIVGRVIDVRVLGIGNLNSFQASDMTGALLLCTNGLRTPPPSGSPFRQMSTRVGLVIAVAFGRGLSVNIDEAYRLAGDSYVNAWRERCLVQEL